MTCIELEQKYRVPKVLIRNLIKFLGIPMFVGRGGNDYTEDDLRLLDEVLEYLTSKVKLQESIKLTKKPKLKTASACGIGGTVIKKTKDRRIVRKQVMQQENKEGMLMSNDEYQFEEGIDYTDNIEYENEEDIEYVDDSNLEEEEFDENELDEELEELLENEEENEEGEDE